jgi:hypothetical protein
MKPTLTLFTALLLAPLAAQAADALTLSPVPPDATFSQIAQPSGFSPEMPKLSEVCMRLFRLDQKGVSPERMLAAGEEFHITRGVWSYIEDEAFIKSVRAKGWEFQGSLNMRLTDPALALRDRKGKPIGTIGPSDQPPYRADNANMEYRRLYLERAKRLVDMGVTSFQRDDPDGGFFDWGKKGLRDAIPNADLLEFHRWARTEIEKHAARKLTFSTNFHSNPPFMQVFDYRMTEVRFRSMDGTKEVISPSRIREIGLAARKEKKLFVLTGQEDRPAEDYRWIWATSYATGNLYIVPWDQFQNVVLDPVTRVPRIPVNKLPRIFIAKEKLADLTGFVRANADVLDGYEEAAVGGYDLQDTRFGDDAPLRIEGGSGKLSAFLRAKPGDANAPVVIHLVEKEKGAAATLRLSTARFFGRHKLKVTLREPLPYDAALHAQAENDKHYRSLLRETILPTTTEGASTLVSVPAISPWGILVVEQIP